MNSRGKPIKMVLIALFCAGMFLGWHTVDVDHGDGKWVRLESSFRFVWDELPSAKDRTDLQKFAGVRVNRWYCYGLWYISHTQYR